LREISDAPADLAARGLKPRSTPLIVAETPAAAMEWLALARIPTRQT
jgi:hypothetical protein